MTVNDVMQLIKDKGIQAVDLRFIDLPGLWQHFTVSAKEFEADVFEEGIGFDGSSIRETETHVHAGGIRLDR